jgi:putative Mn2+ efflux pump MntP
MSYIAIILLAFSVAADAFAVSVATGISERKIRKQDAFRMAFSFWLFQAVMPIIGFMVASMFARVIGAYDHWIAFGLLLYIGGNMTYEWWRRDDENKEVKNTFSIQSLIILGIATSIDALAVGVSLTATTDNILLPALCIGGVTFVLSFIGVEFGKRWWEQIGKNAEIIGGLVLIGIGTKILISHLMI